MDNRHITEIQDQPPFVLSRDDGLPALKPSFRLLITFAAAQHQ